MEQEPHAQITGRRPIGLRDRSVRDEFERHTRSIVWYAEEIRIYGCEVRETEEGLKAGVGAELDVQFAFPLAGDGGVEGLDDLCREGCAGDGADGVGGVVCEGEFVRVGEGAKLEEGVRGQEGGGGEGFVVDGCDV